LSNLKTVEAIGDPQSIPEYRVEQSFFDWSIWAFPKQMPPEGDWTTWLLIGGRGSGKTRAGAEWVRKLAQERIGPIALVGETMTEAISIMVRGESGILNVHPEAERPVLKGNGLYWPNGTEAMILSASDPERFRGPQFAAAWCDEVGKWPHSEDAWDQLQFGLRLGDRPRQLATTTPRPTKLMKRLLGDPQTRVVRMTTMENQAQLAPQFLSAVVARYQGTVLGRQELEGELIEDRPDAIWQRTMFGLYSGDDIGRTVVAVDPPATSTKRSDACGIIVAGKVGEGAVVIQDYTVKPAKPMLWAERAVAAYYAHDADCIVVEVNQGGDMVSQIIRQVDDSVPIRTVHATRGKWTRAEPVAALYARGLVAHMPGLTALEDEMCGFGSDGKSDGHSPDRVDALVWALTELLLNDRRPRVLEL
jgi:phage terminase large subunit-like protein